MAELVYPGAIHSRFQHALGAMHLMGQAIGVLRSKSHFISDEECEAAQIAILLHDIGHGPFSHVLEFVLLDNVRHEKISALLMQTLNGIFSGKLEMAIRMFEGTYHRPFFHQLVSSQLDMDRMDYLNRDSFFTGVVEGQVGVDRIIKMLNVHNEQLVVEEKGLLSVESFLHARRIMYWQVYLHKTAICAEVMLLKIFERVRALLSQGEAVNMPDRLRAFLGQKVGHKALSEDKSLLEAFTSLDDIDIWFSIKEWQFSSDVLLSELAGRLVRRDLFKISIGAGYDPGPDEERYLAQLSARNIPEADKKYYYERGAISNSGYIKENSNINILTRNKGILDVSEASDLPTIKALSNIVKKNYLCYTNDVYL